MEFELWYLIAVPILFAAGWWLRGVDFKQHKKATQGIDEHYAKGLSLLLSDDPVKADKAIDLFIEVVRLDPETIELHHAAICSAAVVSLTVLFVCTVSSLIEPNFPKKNVHWPWPNLLLIILSPVCTTVQNRPTSNFRPSRDAKLRLWKH